MARIAQSEQKSHIFSVVSQLRIADETGFVKRGSNNNIENNNNSNGNIT